MLSSRFRAALERSKNSLSSSLGSSLGGTQSPVLIANIGGFWNPLLALIEHMAQLGFVHSPDRFAYLIANSIDEIVPLIRQRNLETTGRNTDKRVISKL
jgi:predicted Rossmann-fold nucleotide-binding protein